LEMKLRRIEWTGSASVPVTKNTICRSLKDKCHFVPLPTKQRHSLACFENYVSNRPIPVVVRPKP
jgi:hypothetical protein